MAPDYQPAMESCPTNIRIVLFYDTVVLIEVVITLFIAGIIVPSLIRSDLATKEALAAGSLRTINVAGIAFSYTHQNVEFAVLGALAGSMTAFGIDFLAATPKNTTYTRTTTYRAPPTLKLS